MGETTTPGKVGYEGTAVQEPLPFVASIAHTKRSSRIRSALTGIPGRPQRLLGAAATLMLLVLAGVVMSDVSTAQLDVVCIAFAGVILAGLYFGAPGGIASGLATMALVSPLGPSFPPPTAATWVTEGGIAVFIGFAAGARTYLLERSFSECRHMADKLDTTYRNTLYLIAEAVEIRDPITGGHSRRVAANARTVGAHLGLSEQYLDILYWAGLLHDLGKISVSEAILQKPSKLDPEEWAVMREHPSRGKDLIIRASPDFLPIAIAVGTHHECWDGTGYPDNLAGHSIPLSGRILAVVDVFEALTSARPYRDPLSADAALAYLSSIAGTGLDPTIVALFADLVSKKRIVIAPFEELQDPAISQTPDASTTSTRSIADRSDGLGSLSKQGGRSCRHGPAGRSAVSAGRLRPTRRTRLAAPSRPPRRSSRG